MGTKELLGLSTIVENTIESLDISKEERELMYEILLIEKDNRDREAKLYREKYQEQIKKFTDKKKDESEQKPVDKSELKPELKPEPNTKSLSFLSIRLKNYRQFYDDSGKINLGPDNGKMINIIQGANGWGKSNILNAINYCLFLNEPHLKEASAALPIVNKKAIEEAKDGKEIEMIIELELGNKEKKYRIDRKITVTKGKLSKTVDPDSGELIYDVKHVPKLKALLPVGVELDDMLTSYKYSQGDNWDDRNFTAGVESLLPKQLIPFFFLDGEFLESLNTTFEGIELGVKEISHISLTEKVVEHLPKILKVYEKKASGQNDDQDKLLEEKNRHETWLQSLDQAGEPRFDETDPILLTAKGEKSEECHPFSGIPRKKSKEKERSRIKARIELLLSMIQKDNAELKLEWGGELEEIVKTTLPNLEEKLIEKKEEKLKWIITYGPQIYLSSCMVYTCGLVDTKRNRGQLPVKYSDWFYNDLMEKGDCICGTSLSDNTAKENLRIWHDVEKADERLDAAVDATTDFKSTLKSLPESLEKIDVFRRDIKELDEKIKKTRDKKTELETKLDGVNKDEMKTVNDEYHARDSQKDGLDQQIAELTARITSRERDRNIAKKSYNQMVKSSKKRDESIDKLETCQNLSDNFQKVVESVTKRMRKEIGETTKNNFKKLIGKQRLISNVVLNETYRLTVTDSDGWNTTGSLSAGEKLCLALAYIAAIRGMTGYQMPLIIDTPLSKISGTPTSFIGEHLPGFLSNTQLTLLVTDKEYQSSIVDPDDSTKFSDTFRKTIKESVNKEYLLVYDEEKKSTSFKSMPEMR